MSSRGNINSNSAVKYVDASALQRPQSLSGQSRIFALILAIAGVIIGGSLVMSVLNATVFAAERAQDEVNAVLSRQVSLDLPVLTDLMGYSDVELQQVMLNEGYNAFDLNAATGSDEIVFDWVKLPSDVNLTDGSSYYVKGINSLTGAQAATALYGSWRLTVEHGDYTSARLRYVDFSAKTADEAIQNAFKAQKLESSEMGESGTDDVGNIFSSGTLTNDSGVYGWKISTCSLKEIYDVTGLPKTAYFVSVRVTG